MKPRVYLKKIVAEDFEAFYSMAGNEKVMKMITGKAQTRAEARIKFNSLLANNRWKESLGSFMVFARSDSRLLGFAKLEIKDQNQQEAELGYSLLPEFWGRGYGREIAEHLMHLALQEPDLDRVYAITDPDNIASRKILLHLGFVSEKKGEMDGLPSEIFGRSLG